MLLFFSVAKFRWHYIVDLVNSCLRTLVIQKYGTECGFVGEALMRKSLVK